MVSGVRVLRPSPRRLGLLTATLLSVRLEQGCRLSSCRSDEAWIDDVVLIGKGFRDSEGCHHGSEVHAIVREPRLEPASALGFAMGVFGRYEGSLKVVVGAHALPKREGALTARAVARMQFESV